MAFSGVSLVMLYGAGIVVFLIALYFILRFFEMDLFGLASGMLKSKKEGLVKTQNVPEDKMYRIINEKEGFNELVSGFHTVGKDEKTGVELIKFKYGDDHETAWSIPFDEHYFLPTIRKNFAGKGVVEYRIANPGDTIVKLKNEISRLELYSKGLHNKLGLLSEDEKMRMQKHTEYQREERRIATGWTPSYTSGGYTPFRPYRPWSNIPPGEGEEQMV